MGQQQSNMRPGLKPLNPALPSAMAKLPNEMIEAIVVAAVTEGEPIDITVMDKEIAKLVKPFADFPLFRQIAEREVMRVNTFQLRDLRGDELNEIGYPSRDRKRVHMTWSWTSPTVPVYTFTITGRVSVKIREILQLEVYYNNWTSGGTFVDQHAVASIKPIPLDEIGHRRLGELPLFFPKLQTLDVKVRTVGDMGVLPEWRTSLGRYDWSSDMNDPRFAPLIEKEKMLRMEMFLALVGALEFPGLRKAVTFVQDQRRPQSAAFDGASFHAPRAEHESLTAEYSVRTYREHCRFAFFFCELMGWDKSAGRIRLTTCGKSKCHHPAVLDVLKEEQNGVAKKDLQMLQDMLKQPRAVFEYPCKYLLRRSARVALASSMGSFGVWSAFDTWFTGRSGLSALASASIEVAHEIA